MKNSLVFRSLKGRDKPPFTDVSHFCFQFQESRWSRWHFTQSQASLYIASSVSLTLSSFVLGPKACRVFNTGIIKSIVSVKPVLPFPYHFPLFNYKGNLSAYTFQSLLPILYFTPYFPRLTTTLAHGPIEGTPF